MQCPSRMPPVGTIPCQVFTYAKSLPLPHGTCGLAHALRFGHFLLSLPCAPCKWPRLPDPPGLQVPAMLEVQVVPTLNMDTSTYIRCVVPGAAHLRCPSVVLHGRALSARRDFLLCLDGPRPTANMQATLAWLGARWMLGCSRRDVCAFALFGEFGIYAPHCGVQDHAQRNASRDEPGVEACAV
jgi:hypothetical protein